ncbi:hypothetical protein QZM82_31815 [Burkholderia cepacia]|uniref:hypothetical protein n=1 Tax=Burkholderia cepacia TaxID=292 RepID=UPI0026505BA8|nr:hypothetical protein [Burkholderia cepacia]MDN7900787.1 hypothetical protein [Burkholderia cepacia]
MKAFFGVVWHPLRYLLRFAWFRRFAPVWLVAVLLLWAAAVELLNRTGLAGAATVMNDLIVVRFMIMVIEEIVGATFSRSGTTQPATIDPPSEHVGLSGRALYTTSDGRISVTPANEGCVTFKNII